MLGLGKHERVLEILQRRSQLGQHARGSDRLHRHSLLLQRSAGSGAQVLQTLAPAGRVQQRTVQQHRPVLLLRPAVRHDIHVLRQSEESGVERPTAG